MSRIYSDPARANETHAITDVEVFHLDYGDDLAEQWPELMPGWYYWYCFPGCLPEGDPTGPFKTEEEAINACQESVADGL